MLIAMELLQRWTLKVWLALGETSLSDKGRAAGAISSKLSKSIICSPLIEALDAHQVERLEELDIVVQAVIMRDGSQ